MPAPHGGFDISAPTSERMAPMKRIRPAQIATCLAFFAIVALLTVAGLKLRRWTWEQSATIHYAADMDNAWNWGSKAAREGYFSLYDNVIRDTPDRRYGLDYVPLRLGVMTLWARWATAKFPDATQWRRDYDFNAPLLRFNAFMEFAAAVGMFFLVRQWIRKEREPRPEAVWRSWVQSGKRCLKWLRERRAHSNDIRPNLDGSPVKKSTDTGKTPVLQESIPQNESLPVIPAENANSLAPSAIVFAPADSTPPGNDALVAPLPVRFFQGHWVALLAAALVWFNAASIFSSFGRPTWDVWVIPFYIWAVFFASRNNWFIAGLLVGVGAMLKGQQLVIAPFFVLWPIFSLRFGAAIRWLIGLALGAGLIVSPWLVWLTPSWGPVTLCVVAILIGPMLWAVARYFAKTRRFARVRWAVWISGFCLGAAIWCIPLLFPVSMSWMNLGFVYGYDKMPNLENGKPSSVASILALRYGWNSDHLAATVPFTTQVLTIKELLATIGYLLIAVCAGAAAWHARKRDRRFLLAAAAPWLVYFAVFPMMHERYLLWASIMTAAAVAVDIGALWLHFLITAFSWNMEMDQMLRDGNARGFGTAISPTFGQSLHHFTQGTIPDSGWAVALICLVWLFLIFGARSRRT